jgi:hypothetical protein
MRKPALVILAAAFAFSAMAEIAKPAPKFDSTGHMTVAGKKAFPIGTFVSFNAAWMDNHPTELLAQMDDLANSHFNFTINYAGRDGSAEQRKRYYEQLSKRGLVEFVGLEKFFKNLGNPSKQLQFEGTEQQAITREVNLAKDWQGIAGWYLWDEEPYDPALITQHHEWVKQLDPSRPTLSLTSRHDLAEIRKYAHTGDIYALDRYPIPVRGSMTIVADAMDRMCQSGGKDQPLWFVLQTFGDYVYADEVRSGQRMMRPEKLRGPMRAPTPEEIQCMTFLSLTHGASGLVVYYYKDIKLSADADVRWKAVKSTAKAVEEIAPILLSPPLPQNQLQCDNPEIHWRAFLREGKTYIVAVNATRDLQTAWLDGFPKPISKANVIQGNSLAVASNESGAPRLVMQLDALETVVVEVQFKP